MGLFTHCANRLAFYCILLSSSMALHAACNCPAPTDCAAQPMAPCSTPSGSTYIMRYSVAGENGAMTFIGNTLGLSKQVCEGEPGTSDGIGAFITTDPTQQVGSYISLTTGPGSPAGTTLNWRENGSSAVLSLPPGSSVLYAELIWSGSYGYYCDTPETGNGIGVDPNCVLMYASGPITLTTPDNVVHQITADPATSLISQNPATDVQPYYCAGNYTRSANITNLFTAPSLANPNGTYTVGGVPASISQYDDVHNAAGWTLAIIYRNPSISTINNMTLFVSNQQGSSITALPAEVSGFCAAPSQTIGSSARLLVSAIEGDANKTGDQMLFGPTATTLQPLSGPNNPVDNFFCSQINDDTGALINTTGTYCTFNPDPFTGTDISGGRQGYDITNIDCSSLITPGQTQAFAQGITNGDDYTINALGIQISVNAPVIVPTLKVNGQYNINAHVGDVVTFTAVIENTGSGSAGNVLLQDILQQGLVFIPGSFMINGATVPNADLVSGVPLGSINTSETVAIQFQATIAAPPLVGDLFSNFVTTPFEFIACSQTEPFQLTNNSNVVTIDPPDPLSLIDAPSNFNGTLEKCKFLNKTVYNLESTWAPSSDPALVSYLIYNNTNLVATIPASGPYVYATCLHSKKEASEIVIVAVDSTGAQSAPLNLRIINE